MKKFNRVLAMLLALITVLATLPISVLADDWLNVDADKTKVENVTSTDVTVTVDPKALLSYIQDGDIKGLLKGVSATGGLGSIMTKKELLAIFPEEQIIALAKSIISDIDAKALLDCIDADKLLACVDTDGLIALLKDMDLKSYIRDIDVLMNYIDKGDIQKAVKYIDTEALINNDEYSKKLVDLALALESDKLLEIVDINAVVELDCIDLAAAAKGYFEALSQTDIDSIISEYVAVSKVEALLQSYNYQTLIDNGYMDADKAAAVVEANIDKEALKTNNKYWENNDPVSNKLNVNAVVDDNLVDGLYNKLLNGDQKGNEAAINISLILFGTDEKAPLLSLASLIADDGTGSAINVDGLVADEDLAPKGYASLVNIGIIVNQIKEDPQMIDNVLDCLVKPEGSEKPDYTAIVNVIGVEKVVEAVGGYKTVLDYVTDFKGLIGEFDVVAIAKGVLRDGVITKVIDAKGLIMDINVRAFVSKVDVKQLIKVIYAEGVDVAKELFGMLDFEAYIVDVFSIIATMQTTISEIKIDGVTVTTQNDDGFLKLNPTKLFDGLENLIPTLDELANLDDSGKLFSASFAISYYEDDVEKTKEINFNFVLTAGTDMIRRAAAKLSAMLDKIGYADLTDGKLVAEVKVPSEFASVLRIALEKMADSSDPAMNALKDKVLAAYAAQPDDFIAFAKELTLEEIIAVLEAIDPALFGKVYNKVLASHYAEVLISYIERFVDKELSDNFEVKRLIKSLETIPTFEELVEKLENVVGIEITDHLPAKVNGYLDNTAYDVIEKLASAAGYEFDMENLLKAAAASSDPFAYLYTAVVNKAENASGVYNFVKRNAIRVADRLMATRVGNVIADNCLMDFYAGDSKFVFEKSVTFDAKVLIEKGFNKVLNFVGARISVNEEKANELLDFAMDTIFENGPVYITTGFDVSVRVNNLYRVTFKDNNGKVVLNTLLPVGTDLSKMLNYANYEGAEGWVNVKNGKPVSTMPAEDIVVKATVEGDIETEEPDPPVVKEWNINVVVKDKNGVVKSESVATVVDGTTITLRDFEEDLLTARDKIFDSYTKQPGYTYEIAWETDLDAQITVTDHVDVVAIITEEEIGGSTEEDLWNINVVVKDKNGVVKSESVATVVDGTTITLRDFEEDLLNARDEIFDSYTKQPGYTYEIAWETDLDTQITVTDHVDVVAIITEEEIGGSTEEKGPWNINVVVKDPAGNPFGNSIVISEIEDGTLLSELQEQLDTALASVLEAYVGEKLSLEEALLGYTYTTNWDEVKATLPDTVTENITVEVNISKVHDSEKAAITITGEGVQIDNINFNASDAVIVTVGGTWKKLNFTFTKEFFDEVKNAGKALVLASTDGKEKITFSNDLVVKLCDKATATFTFEETTVENAKNKAKIYNFSLFAGTENLGNGFFDGDDIEFVLPFAGANGADGVKTFVEIDDGTVLEGGEDVTINANGTISFNAPHFSTYTIVNKYRLSYNASNPTFGLLDFDEKLVATINGSIATIVDGWYEEGATVQVTVTPNGDNTECEYLATDIDGTMYKGNSFSFQMPAKAVTAEFYAKPVVYKVYYYVDGDLTDTVSYSVLDYKYGNDNTDTFKNGLLTFVPTLGDGEEWSNEWKWFGSITPGANIFLFGVNDQETQATVTFKNKETGATIKTYTHSINDWRKSALATLKFTIDSWTLDNEQVVYNWTNDDNVTLADLTVNMLIASTINPEGVVFYGEPEIPQYQINIQGDATIEGNKTEAAEGATIKVVPSVKAGYTATITVQTVGGDAVDVNSDGIFEMPASDVIVIVSYTLNPVTYQYITITVPAGSVLNATDLTTLGSAPADMVLYKAERTAAGELKLTYRYIGTIDEAAFRAEVDALIASAQYATSWIVDGVVYNSEAEAMNAELPEGATIVGWTEMSDNVKVAIIEYTAPKAGVSVWVIVCIILVVLLLIAVIALVYVLHITDKIGASWLTKVCTAIVSVFFAFCMILAKATLKVLNFMGIKTEDILEELPEEEPVEDIPAVILDFEIPAEETAEEAVAEEAPVEEATEETAEEAVVEEAPVEEATEEAAEEAVAEEAPAEEATEEAAEEAVAEETPAEEATEEAAEEAVVEEVPAEEATEEAAEEAVAEEAPAEEATEEAAEEAVAEEAPAEEATEEAVEEAVVEEAPAEEATEEAAEEVVAEEAPVEEATEEAVEEAVAEEAPAEEATEEAAEEVVEEAPAEEATEETSEEEKKDE